MKIHLTLASAMAVIVALAGSAVALGGLCCPPASILSPELTSESPAAKSADFDRHALRTLTRQEGAVR